MNVAQVTMECCVHNNICLHTWCSMAHSAPSLMIPPSLSTSPLLTCTPIRPSIRPSTGPLQISSSDEIYHCGDPIVSFCSLADLNSPTISNIASSPWTQSTVGHDHDHDRGSTARSDHPASPPDRFCFRSLGKNPWAGQIDTLDGPFRRRRRPHGKWTTSHAL